MRDYELAIPSDCVISNTAKENTEALQLMKRYLKADTPPFSVHYFWETRAAPIISVEPRILSYRPATRRPSQLVAGENVVICRAIIPAKTPNQRRK